MKRAISFSYLLCSFFSCSVFFICSFCCWSYNCCLFFVKKIVRCEKKPSYTTSNNNLRAFTQNNGRVFFSSSSRVEPKKTIATMRKELGKSYAFTEHIHTHTIHDYCEQNKREHSFSGSRLHLLLLLLFAACICVCVLFATQSASGPRCRGTDLTTSHDGSINLMPKITIEYIMWWEWKWKLCVCVLALGYKCCLHNTLSDTHLTVVFSTLLRSFRLE